MRPISRPSPSDGCCFLSACRSVSTPRGCRGGSSAPDERVRCVRHETGDRHHRHVTIAVVLPYWPDRPAGEALEVATAADELGFDELWIGEMATYDAFA